MIQIYTAFTAFFMLALAADAQHPEGSLYEFANMMSVSLTESIHFKDLLGRCNSVALEPQKEVQPTLFDFDKL